MSVLQAALLGSLGGLWLVVLHRAVHSGVGRAGLHIPFSAVLGIHWVVSRGRTGSLTMCHFSDYAGIHCDKGLLFPHHLSLREHMKKLKSSSSACSLTDVPVPFGLGHAVCSSLSFGCVLQQSGRMACQEAETKASDLSR